MQPYISKREVKCQLCGDKQEVIHESSIYDLTDDCPTCLPIKEKHTDVYKWIRVIIEHSHSRMNEAKIKDIIEAWLNDRDRDY